MIRTRAHLEQAATARKPGWMDEILKVAKQVGDGFEIEQKDWHELTAKFHNPSPEFEDPSVPELAGRLAYAAWLAAREKLQHGTRFFVSADIYEERAKACASCEYWDGSARFGYGHCKAPGCGCTRFKQWVTTQKCTHPGGSRWPAI